jgi:phosphatidate cytidylyltransferase
VFRAVLIERGPAGSEHGVVAARASTERMIREMGDRDSLIVFPEGTRSPNGQIGTATHQWALMICVYFVSYVPALLMLRIPGYEGQTPKLMFFLVLVVQLSDVLQYVWGKSLGSRPIAPSISPNKTWEGFVGGLVCATVIGTATWWATPFSPAVAALMALVITTMGFVGGLIMSAIKRDRGVKDYGVLIGGHGGVLDRIDSLCFAAPVFFYLTRYFYMP